MTYEGRLRRGKAYAESGRHPTNPETIAYLDSIKKVEKPQEKPKDKGTK